MAAASATPTTRTPLLSWTLWLNPNLFGAEAWDGSFEEQDYFPPESHSASER